MNKREEYLHNREINRRARVRELTERARKHFDKMYEDRIEAIEKNSKKW
jgi:hypothetical protein|tara:strand:+ start:4853 stop:4999 length:147 start_codon:yes stop_codon:yes gene_type:complete